MHILLSGNQSVIRNYHETNCHKSIYMGNDDWLCRFRCAIIVPQCHIVMFVPFYALRAILCEKSKNVCHPSVFSAIAVFVLLCLI